MEAVAAAASIAGIITLVFQSIDGLVKFKELFDDAASASKTIDRLLDDINGLIQLLEDVQNVAEKLEAKKGEQQNFASLDLKLADCSKDIHVWLSTARILRPSAEHGGRAWWKKIRLAVNKDAIQTIRNEIGRHRQLISLSLSVFGRNIDIDTSEQVHRIGSSMSQSLSNHEAQEQTLQRIENYSRASLHSSAHSIRSMETIRHELSRLESLINSSSRDNQAANSTGLQSTGSGALDAHMSNSSARPVSSSARAENTPMASQTHPSVEAVSLETNRIPVASSSKASSTKTGRSAPKIKAEAEIRGEELRYESSFLYASYSTSQVAAKPSQIQGSGAAIHDLLTESLAMMYPPCVVDYISVRQLLKHCESHTALLVHQPEIRFQKASIDSEAPLNALQKRTKELQEASRSLRQHCVQSGYPLMELDILLGSQSRPQVGRVDELKAGLGACMDSDEDDWADASEGMTAS